MKQKIKARQLAELSEEGLKRLTFRFYPPMYMMGQLNKNRLLDEKNKRLEITTDNGTYIYLTSTSEFYPLLSIGQMLDYLGARAIKCVQSSFANNKGFSNLCDDLWNEVKNDLEKDK